MNDKYNPDIHGKYNEILKKREKRINNYTDKIWKPILDINSRNNIIISTDNINSRYNNIMNERINEINIIKKNNIETIDTSVSITKSFEELKKNYNIIQNNVYIDRNIIRDSMNTIDSIYIKIKNL